MGEPKEKQFYGSLQRHGYLKLLFMSVCGILINVAGAQLALAKGWPLFLDSIGTVLAAVLGGYLPGIAVGFATNILNGLADYTTMYYSSVNVMLAICSAWMARKGWFSRPSRFPAAIGALTLIGGGLGSVLTWLLYGFGFGTGISAPLAHAIYRKGALSVFASQLAADMLIDIADKTITVLLAALVLTLLPKALKEALHVYGWMQAPLTEKKLERVEKRVASRFSLRAKVILVVALVIMVIAIGVSGFSMFLYHNAIIEQHTRLAQGVSNLVASQIDPDRVEDYLAQGEAAEGYRQVKEGLTRLVNETEDIAYVYVYRILEDGCHVIFDVDTPDLPGAPAGEVVPFDASFAPLIENLLAGKEIDPLVTDDTYGWLLTVYKPVYDEEGICQCYVGVDVSMHQIITNDNIFLTRVVSLLSGFFILIMAVVVWLSVYHIIVPIDSMAYASGSFAFNTEDLRAESVEAIQKLKIHTGDEIENLYHAMTKTTEDSMGYIEDVQKKSETISKMQNGLILVLADLVEGRDECTGDHIRNTAAYTRIVMEQLRREGQYTDQLTDEFIQDVENSAPLHDLGKIAVPDSLLNKPGKLTEQEFAQMKKHTQAGREIISQAIEAVSEENSGYLKEARNLASYHHEKWDGTGYPKGLAGEEIPLSARIMAVADVFDALVSERSYKKAFPFEDAMEIIRQGKGTHFDPKVAQAFLDAEDEVRQVAQHRAEKA